MNDLISRSAAIEALTRTRGVGNRILDVVRDLPSAQPETHEERTETHACDLISRQAVIDAVNKIMPTKEGLFEPSEVFCELIEVPAAKIDLSGYSDRLWKAAYERGKAEGQVESPEIIRCKDCMFFTTGGLCCRPEGLTTVPTPDDFCSYGERKE